MVTKRDAIEVMTGDTWRVSLSAVCKSLEGSTLSHVLQNVSGLVPLLQTVHILSVAVVMSSTLTVCLSTFGLHANGAPLRRTFGRFRVAITAGVLVLAATGALLVTAEPFRSLPNPVFQLKMMLLNAAVISLWFGWRYLPTSDSTTAPIALRALTTLSVVLCAGVIVSGRWIAYYLAE
jgi:hypothetical protein